MYKAGDPFLPPFDAPPRSATILSFERPQAPERPAPRPAEGGADGTSGQRVVSFAAAAERLRSRRKVRR